MRKRYLAMFMSMVIACTQIVGSVTVAHASDLIVEDAYAEELQEYVDTADEGLTAEAEPEDTAWELEGVELFAEQEELPGEYVSVEEEAAGEVSGEVSEETAGEVSEEISGAEDSAEELNLTEELIASIEEVDVVPTEVLADGEQEIVPEYNYWYPDQDPGDADLVQGWSKQFRVNQAVGAWFKNDDAPNGRDTVAILEDVELTGQWTDASKTEEKADVASVEWKEDEQMWELTALSGGYAEVTLTHESLDPENPDAIAFRIGYFVHEGMYTIDLHYQDGMQSVVRGAAIHVGTGVGLQYRDEHGNMCGMPVDDYYVTVHEDEENGAYNTHRIDARVLEDGKTIEINAFDETGDARVVVDVYANQAGEGEKPDYQCVKTKYLYVNVMDGYRVLRFESAPEELGNLNLGETLDLASWQPVVYQLFAGQEDQLVTEELAYALHYDENAWDPVDPDADIPVLTRKGTWGTDVWLRVYEKITDEAGNESWSEFDCEGLWFDGLNYWTDFQNSYGEYYQDKVFTNDPLTLTLNTEGLNGLENSEDYSVKWFVHGDQEVFGEADFEAFTVKADNTSAIIEAREGHEGEWFNIRAEVYLGETQVTNFHTNIEIRDTKTEYYLPENQEMLPGWQSGFDRTNNGRIFNVQYPHGEGFEYDITSMKVIGIHGCNAEDVMEWGTDDNGNYWYRAKDNGAVQISCTYTDPDGNQAEGAHVFEVYVNGDIYRLHGNYPDNSDQMLCGSSFEIDTWLQWEYFREEEGHHNEEVTDYALQLINWPDTNLVNVELLENNNIRVTANNEAVYGRTSFEVAAWVEGEERTRTWFEVDVTEGYNVIRLEKGEPENCHIGESVDFAAFEPALYTYINQDDVQIDGEEQKNVRWRLEYDENAWEASETVSEEELPVLTRVDTGWGTDVILIAMEDHSEDGSGDWQEVCRRHYHFSNIHYGADFEYLYGHRGESFVYSDRAQVLTLNTEGLSGLEGYRVEWYINGRLNGEGQEDAVLVTIDEENPNTVTLEVPDGADEYDIHVEAKVFSGDREVVTADTGFRMKQAGIDYDLPESREMLPEWDDGFESRRSGRFYNSDCLQGEDFVFDITGITVTGIDDCVAEDVLEWGIDDNGNYWFHAKNHGAVQVSCTYDDPDGNPVEEPHVFDIYVNGDIYRLHGGYPDDSDLMVCGDTLTIDTWLQWEYYREEGHFNEEVAEYALKLINEPDSGIATVELQEDGNIIVTANSEGNHGRVWFEVAAMIGEDEVTRSWFEAEVTEGYHVIHLRALEGEFPDVLLGETLDIAAMEPIVYAFANSEVESVDGVQEPADRVRWRLEYDDNAWRADDAEAELPVLTRIRNWDTEVRLIAEVNRSEDGGEDWQEVSRRHFGFGQRDYHVEPVLWYGGTEPGLVYIGKNQEQAITLNTEGLNGLKNYEVQWYVWDEEKDWNDQPEHVDVTVESDVLHRIYLEGKEDHGGSQIRVRAEIWYEGDEITSFEMGMDVKDTVYEDRLPFDMTWLPGWEDAIGGHRSAWVEDADHLEGAEIPYTITAVQVDPENSDEGVFSYDIDENGFITPDEEGNFWFRAERFGAVKLICTYVFDEDVQQTEYTHELIFGVADKTYGFDANYPMNSSGMLFGSSMDIETYVWIDGYDVDRDEHYTEDIAEYELEIDYDSYDQGLIQAEVDGSVIHVTAFDRHGETHIRATAKVDGEIIAEQQFHVWVTDDICRLEGAYPDDSDQVLCGSSFEIDTWLYREYLREEEGYHNEEIKDYALQLVNEPDKNLVNVELLENNNIRVTANNEGVYGRTSFEVAAFVEGEERTRTWFEVEVTEGYHVIRLDGEFQNPMLGDTLELASMKPTVYAFVNTEDERIDEEPIPAENIRWRLEYDDNAWRAGDAEAELPVLTRIRNWDTEVRLIAEMDVSEDGSGDWQEISRRYFGFGQHDYHVEMNLEYGGTEPGVVFIGEDQDQVITLNMDGLNGLEDYEVKWYVWDGEDKEIPSEHVTFNRIDTNGIHLIQLHGEEGHGGSWITVRAEIWYEDDEIAGFDVGMDVKDTVYEERLPFDMTWLPGWEDAIGGHRNAWAEDADYPEGADIPYTITAVQVDPENSDEGVFSYDIDENGFITPDEDGNFWFRAEHFGTVKLICTYVFDEDEQQTEYTHELIFEVAEKSYGFDANYPMNSSGMLFGSSMDIATYIWVDGYDIDRDEHYREDIFEYELEIDSDSYDQGLIQAEVDGSVIHVTAFDKHGETHIRATAKVDGEIVAEQSFHVWVTDDICHLEGAYPDDMDLMLCGSSFEIDTWLQREYLHEEDGYHNEEIEDYALQLVTEPDKNLVRVKLLGNNNILVTANNKGVHGRTSFEVAAFVEGEERARNWFEVEVTEGYHVIRLDGMEGEFPNPMLGDMLDIASMEPTVYAFVNAENERIDGEAIPAESIRWRLEYDDNAWRADDTEAELPVLTRIRNWDTEVRLIAEMDFSEDGSGDWQEVTRRHYGFGSHDYHVEPELKYGGTEPGVVFIGEDQEQVITLNMDGLNGLEDYEVKWYVWDEEDKEIPSEHVTFNTVDTGSVHLIQLHGKEGHGGSWITVRAEVWYEDDEIAGFDVGMDVKDAVYEDNLPFDTTWLPRWEDAIGGQRSAWVEDADHPEGAEMPYTITKVQVDLENSDEGVFAYNEIDENGFITPDEEGNFWFYAERFGAVKLICTYVFDEDAQQKEYTHELVFEVAGSSYGFDANYPMNSSAMMTGGTMDIETYVWIDGYDIDRDEHYTEDFTGYEIEIDHDSYDQELIQAEVDGNVIRVTSFTKHGDTHIRAMAKVDGEIVAEQQFHVWVTDYYTDLEPTELPEALHNLMPGEELSLDAFGEDLKAYFCRILEDGTTEREYLEDAEFFWAEEEMDMDAWHVTEDGRYIRKRPGGTNIVIEARFTNVNGDEESTRRGFWLPEVDTGIDFEYSYGFRELESIYVGEDQQPLTLTLDTPLPITEAEGYRVDWHLDQYSDELGDNTDEVTAVSWEVSEDGTALTLTANEGQAGEWINVYADVYYICGKEEIHMNGAHTGMRVEEPVYCLAGLETNELHMMMSGGIVFSEYEAASGTYEDEILIRNSYVPTGRTIPVVVSNMTYSYDEDASVDPIEDGYIKTSMAEDGWFVQFMTPGDYTVTMNVKDAETSEAMEDIVLTVHVSDMMHYVEVEASGDTAGAPLGLMLPDDSIQLNVRLMQVTYDAETDERIREEIKVDSWRFEYDPEMVRVTDDGVITAAGMNRGGTWVEVVATAMIDGNQEEIRDGIHVEITGEYFILESETLYLEPGMDAQELDVLLKKYSITNQAGEVSDERAVTAVGWNEKLVSTANTEKGIFVSTPLAEAEEPIYTTVAVEALDKDGDPWAYVEAEIVICSHETTENVTTAPTCQKTGEKHVTCTKCGHEWDEELPVLAHKAEAVAAVAATCTKTGLTAGSKCSACGEILTAQKETPALGHKAETVAGTAATCTKTGLTAGNKCSVCGEVLTAQKVIPATGQHKYDENYTVTKEPSCIAAGSKVRYCIVCNGAAQTVEIPKLEGTITVAASKLTLKLKDSLKASELVTGLMEEDYIENVTTSNKKLVTVKKSGSDWKITAKAVSSKKTDTADITITLASGASAKITFNVQKANVATKTLKVTNTSKKLTLTIGDSFTLETLVNPVTTTDKLTFSTSNKKIVAVSKSGELEAKKAGSATITVKSGKKSAKITVTVKAPIPTDFTLNKEELTLKVKKSATLKAKFIPSGSEAKVTFKTSNKKIATVTKAGKITAKKKGTAIITATIKSATGETLTKTCVVTVK